MPPVPTHTNYPSPPKISSRSRGNGQTRFEKEVAANGGRVDNFGDPTTLGPWVLGDTIGKGSSGRVRLARHVQTGNLAAVKIIPKNLMFSSRMSISNAGAKHDKLMHGIRREIVIMKLIDHPNIMSLYDVFEADNELYLLLEFIEGGELFDFLVSRGRLAPLEALVYFRQIINGVNYCHRFNICHRDLKPENLLLDSHRNIKIADFGMAALEISNNMLETSCGSPHYASPEIVAGRAYHGAASDIWSCGVVLFALLVGRLPFDDPNMRVLLQKVRAGKFEIPGHIPPDARNLLRRMLVVDPEQRIQMSEIMHHPFLNPSCSPLVKEPEHDPLDEVGEAITSLKDIDPECVRNLQTLWAGYTERDIRNSLLSAEPNWLKAYYFLLSRYQSKALEEYDMGYSFGFSNGKHDPPAHLIRGQTASIQTSNADVPFRVREVEGLSSRPPPTIQKGNISKRSSAICTVPTRTGPAVRAIHGTSPPIFYPSPEKGSQPHSLSTNRPAPQSPNKRVRPSSMVVGPRPQSVNPKTPIPDPSPLPPSRLPPGTRRDLDIAQHSAVDTIEMAQTLSPDSTSLAIENTNAEVVRARFGFGNPARAEEFAFKTAIHQPNAGSSSSSRPVKYTNVIPHAGRVTQGLGLSLAPLSLMATPQASTIIGRPQQRPPPNTRTLLPAPSPRPALATPQSSRQSSSKADECSQVVGMMGRISSTPNSPVTLPPPGHFGIPACLPLEHKPGSSSTTADKTTPVDIYPNPLSPSKGINVVAEPSCSRSSDLFRRNIASNGGLMRRASNKENAPSYALGTSVIERGQLKSDIVADLAKPTRKDVEVKRARPAPLELQTTSNRASSIPSPVPSPIPSPLIVGMENKGQGWFSSLFNFKPATYVFYSCNGLVMTRRECASLLESFGANVALEEGIDGHGILKCSIDKLKDSTGFINMKPVKFRVQIQSGGPPSQRSHPPTPSTPGFPNPLSLSRAHSNHQYNQLTSAVSSYKPPVVCTVSIVQERGARSSLEIIATKLRQSWRLEESPALLHSPNPIDLVA